MSSTASNDDSFTLDSNFEQEESQGYDIVTVDIRVKLLQMVCDKGYKISQAAKVLKINESTAKYIVRTFRRKGKVLMKNDKNKIVDEKILEQLKQLQNKFSFNENYNKKVTGEKKLKQRKFKGSKKCLQTKNNDSENQESGNKNNTTVQSSSEQVKTQPQELSPAVYPLHNEKYYDPYTNNQVLLMPWFFNNCPNLLWLPAQNLFQN